MAIGLVPVGPWQTPSDQVWVFREYKLVFIIRRTRLCVVYTCIFLLLKPQLCTRLRTQPRVSPPWPSRRNNSEKEYDVTPTSTFVPFYQPRKSKPWFHHKSHPPSPGDTSNTPCLGNVIGSFPVFFPSQSLYHHQHQARTQVNE